MKRLAAIAALLLLLLPLAAAPAAAKDDLKTIQRVLATNRDPKVRIAQIPLLVANGTDGAATLLGWLVQHDVTLAVRIGAAQGLGRVRSENAGQILVEQIPRGGPRALRHALSDSLGRTQDGPRRAMKAAGQSRRGRLERALLIDALAGSTDDGSREWLGHTLWDDDPAYRYAALRALAHRKDAKPERTTTLGRLLVDLCGDPLAHERLRELLDVIEPALHRTMQPALERLRPHPKRDIAEAAGVLIGKIPDPAPLPPAPGKGPAKPDDRYGTSLPPFRPTLDVPPTPPPSGRREDLVVAFDATGSAHLLLPHVVRWVEDRLRTFESRGVSSRIGVVVFRGAKGRLARAEVLPLTFDLDRVRSFLAEIEARGSDDRGAAVSEGLRQALDLMGWRWNAARRLRVFADSGTDDARSTLRRVKAHHDADGTRTGITYFLRTRTRVPEDLEALARAGGTAYVETFDRAEPLRRRR